MHPFDACYQCGVAIPLHTGQDHESVRHPNAPISPSEELEWAQKLLVPAVLALMFSLPEEMKLSREYEVLAATIDGLSGKFFPSEAFALINEKDPFLTDNETMGLICSRPTAARNLINLIRPMVKERQARIEELENLLYGAPCDGPGVCTPLNLSKDSEGTDEGGSLSGVAREGSTGPQTSSDEEAQPSSVPEETK